MSIERELISFDQAMQNIAECRLVVEPNYCRLSDCNGRILSKDISARHTTPPFDASAMDGYAVRFDDVCDTLGELSLIGEVPAGSGKQLALAHNQAVRVFTGSPMPQGADHVVIQEHAEEQNGVVRVRQPQNTARHVRRAGGDFHTGDLLIKAGTRLRASHIGLAAAGGYGDLLVDGKPHVAILTVGNELKQPGEELNFGQIVESNSHTLSSLFAASGACVTVLGTAVDDIDSIQSYLGTATKADLIVCVGGASVGKYDLVRQVFDKLGGKVVFGGIAMRPGKPTWFGILGSQKVLGLPGNPTAAFVLASLFCKPLMLGIPELEKITASLDGPLTQNGPREVFERARFFFRDGKVFVESLRDQDTSRLKVLTSSNCLLHRPANDNAKHAGQHVTIFPIWYR